MKREVTVRKKGGFWDAKNICFQQALTRTNATICTISICMFSSIKSLFLKESDSQDGRSKLGLSFRRHGTCMCLYILSVNLREQPRLRDLHFALSESNLHPPFYPQWSARDGCNASVYSLPVSAMDRNYSFY